MPNDFSTQLDSFTPANYYKGGDNYTRLYPISIPLIAQYYTSKYATEITLVSLDASRPESYENLKNVLASARKQADNSDEYRQAIIMMLGVTHASPIVYMKQQKEKGMQEEGILVADSTGDTSSLNLALWIKNTLKIDIYRVKEARQADDFSCLSDALFIGRESTRKEKGKYVLPDLLDQIKGRSTGRRGLYSALLPDELLKTAQISSFVATHKNPESNKIVHYYKNKGETLEKFRERYKKTIFFKEGEKLNFSYKNKFQTEEDFEQAHKNTTLVKDKIHGYLREKGLKYIDIIEIQFYINEIKKITGDLFTSDKQQQFIKDAKQALRENTKTSEARLHELATKFSNDLMSSRPRANP